MTDAQRLAYAGEPITLNDGRRVHVKYGMRALMRLEAEFGSLAALGAAVQPEAGTVRFTPALKWLAAGLGHEHDGAGAPLHDAERLADFLDPADLEGYMAAAGKAFSAAFPAAGGPGNAPGEAPQTVASPGPTGTTPSP